MSPTLTALLARTRAAAARVRALIRDDRGYSTETVLVTALLVALAIAVIAIIAAKVTGKANAINLG